jgi:hypothetical protein
MWAVKNDQTLRLPLEIPPMRVGFGEMATDGELFLHLQQAYGDMAGERAIFCRRHQNDERIGTHESDRGHMISDTKMFRNVHENLLLPSLAGLTPFLFCTRALAPSTSAITAPASSCASP